MLGKVAKDEKAIDKAEVVTEVKPEKTKMTVMGCSWIRSQKWI